MNEKRSGKEVGEILRKSAEILEKLEENNNNIFWILTFLPNFSSLFQLISSYFFEFPHFYYYFFQKFLLILTELNFCQFF